MKKSVLAISLVLASATSFANDEFIAQTFAPGVEDGQIEVLSSEEMQDTKGAYSALDMAPASLINSTLSGAVWGSLTSNLVNLGGNLINGEIPTMESVGYATLRGFTGGAIGGGIKGAILSSNRSKLLGAASGAAGSLIYNHNHPNPYNIPAKSYESAQERYINEINAFTFPDDNY